MTFLGQEDQGLLALISLVQILFVFTQYRTLDPACPDGLLARLFRSVSFLLFSWGMYSIPWFLMAIFMNFAPAMVLSPLFFVLGTFAGIGACVTRNPRHGAFIGGGVPLAVYALYSFSTVPQFGAIASPLAWFGAFLVIGGLIGGLTGPAVLPLVNHVQDWPGISAAVNLGSGHRARVEKGVGSAVFDAFLSHNSSDKPTVRLLASALRNRGVRVWLDEDQLIPGRPWQSDLEEVIRQSRSSLVLVGKDGLGPWEIPELQACLSQCVERGMPVIPVLLPEAPLRPELPLFLRNHTWVDLRGGLTHDGIDRLIWGITGLKPNAGSPQRADPASLDGGGKASEE